MSLAVRFTRGLELGLLEEWGEEVDPRDEDFKIIRLGTMGVIFIERGKKVYDLALLGKDAVSWGRMLSGKGAKQQWCEDLEV